MPRQSKRPEKLAALPGVSILNDSYFNEFTVLLPSDAREVVRDLADRSILGGVSLGRLYPDVGALSDAMLVTVTETCEDSDVDALVSALGEILA